MRLPHGVSLTDGLSPRRSAELKVLGHCLLILVVGRESMANVSRLPGETLPTNFLGRQVMSLESGLQTLQSFAWLS